MSYQHIGDCRRVLMSEFGFERSVEILRMAKEESLQAEKESVAALESAWAYKKLVRQAESFAIYGEVPVEEEDD